MTALAAIWTGVGDISSARSLERMLDAQALYGSGARQRLDHGDAAVGIMLRALLPEDRFDRQPLALQAGRFSFVADLRLDNRAELIAALSPRTDAAQLSDAAIAGLAFEAWEEKSFDRLRGDFAIIVWDAAKHRFILARDGFGTRPLYFHHRPGLMAAASMPKGLNALEHMPRRPDIDFIEASAQRMSMYGDGTFWLGIRRVLPGHYAVVSADAVQQTRYWQPEIRLLKLRNHAEYAEALRERIDHAVRVRLRGETNVATHLSAGLDSGAITATVAQMLGASGSVTAFTAAPRLGYAETAVGALTDESPIAAETAAMYGNISHVVLRPKAEWTTRELDRQFDLSDTPAANICNLTWINAINDELRNRKIKVLMPGAMGNLAMSHSGEATLIAYVARRDYLGFLRNILDMWPIGPRHMVRSARTALYAAGPARLRRRLQGAAHNPLRSALDHSHSLGATYGEILSSAIQRIDMGPLNKAALGGWGVDTRDPTTDRDLVEFSLAVPGRQNWQHGHSRALIRSAMQGRMAESALMLEQRGVQAADWHEGAEQHRDWLREQLAATADFAEANRIIDTNQLMTLLDNWPTEGWQSGAVVNPYRFALLRGVSMSHFIRRASRSNR